MENQLTVIDGETLLNTPLPPIRFVVSGLLPQGLHILAGAPKVGKSWLALWLCLCVAKGEPVWSFPTERGTVLHLCLEDSYSRIQNRLLDLTDDAPDNVFFATLSARLGDGLEKQVDTFLTAHPGTTLVVIDTLQRIRTAASDANPYAGDYRDIGILKALADRHGIAILLIHHLRKMNDDDPMNMISGTTGISGATDSNFVLRKDKRGSSTATLYCTGRDIEYRELMLDFDSATHIWKLVSDSVTAEPVPKDEIIVPLSAFLAEQASFTGTATEVAEILKNRGGIEIAPAALTKRLIRGRYELVAAGIRFTISRTRERRELHFLSEHDGSDGSDGSDGKNDTDAVPILPSQLSQPSQEEV